MKASVIVTACYSGLLLLLSATPSQGTTAMWMPSVPPDLADLLHAPAFGALAWLLIVCFRSYGVARRTAVIAAIAVATTCGVIVELVQASAPGRTPSLSDGLMDVAGILAACGCYLLIHFLTLKHLLPTRVRQ
jgi:VanZ family protein